jgi:hypothetical protein
MPHCDIDRSVALLMDHPVNLKEKTLRIRFFGGSHALMQARA